MIHSGGRAIHHLQSEGKGGGNSVAVHRVLLWLMWWDSDRVLPLIHQDLDLAVSSRARAKITSLLLSQRNGARCRGTVLGGSVWSRAGCSASGLHFLSGESFRTEHPSPLSARDVMMAVGHVVQMLLWYLLRSLADEVQRHRLGIDVAQKNDGAQQLWVQRVISRKCIFLWNSQVSFVQH